MSATDRQLRDGLQIALLALQHYALEPGPAQQALAQIRDVLAPQPEPIPLLTDRIEAGDQP